MSESQHVLERHKDAVLRSAAFITYRYEHGQQLDLRREFDHFIQHNRHRRGPHVGRGSNIVIYGPKGELVFGKPQQHADHRAHIEFKFTSGADNVYKIVSDRPQPPRFVMGWLARMHSIGFVFILLASAFVSLLLTWMITRPLKNLGAHARHLASGDFATPMERKLLKRGDEIGDLAQEFDGMANRLGEMIESRQQLLHDVSHELRAPLARLQAAAALNQQRGASLDAATLQRVERECERMDKLIQQILDYARTEQEQALAEPIDLDALLEELVADVRLEYNTHPISLQLSEESTTVQGNGELLRRAFENVLRNACKHTAEGTAVDVNLSRQTDTILLSIRDHGPGIEEQDVAQLLEPFYRAGNSMHGDGFGLGLSIAARAIEKHAGRIDAVNHPQGGLQVSISLKAS
ncbi:MAG: sensor histidine kinase [Pseudomonadales bacterium]